MYGGSLKGSEVYKDFAEYFVRYIKAFEAEGITIDAITLQNEPMHEINTYPTMKMEWEEQNIIIRDYIGQNSWRIISKPKLLFGIIILICHIIQ